MDLIDVNSNLEEIFQKSDPDEIAETMITEMDNIIQTLAPSKIVQRRPKDETKYSQETRDLKEDSDKQLEHAISVGNNEEFRLYNAKRNKFQRELNKENEVNLKKKLGNPRMMWREVNNVIEKKSGEVPSSIVENGKVETSPKRLADIFNDFFVHKITLIRSSFIDSGCDPLVTLNELIPKVSTEFELRPVSVIEVYEVITNMSGTNARGFDSMNSKILKMIPHMASLWLTHLYNNIIHTGKYPKLLKVTRLLPISKPSKVKTSKSSYRPIANLCVFDKVIQELIKQQMSSYFEDNNLILKNHHGGRKCHSTTSARAVIDAECSDIIDNNKLGFILSTNLSAAFDTVDRDILVKQMEHYGVGPKTREIVTSFLSERKQFTEIENRRSDNRESLACSVVQGSKLSSLLYTIYTNEIPLIHELMNNKDWMNNHMKKEITKFTNVSHVTVNYIDDSNNVIGFEDSDEANYYLNEFFQVLKIVYNSNKLQLNSNKTGLLCIARNQKREKKEDIYLYDLPKNIKCKPQLKILGWFVNELLSYDSTINQNIGLVQKTINELQPITKFLNVKQKTMIANSHLVPKISYGSALMIGQDERVMTAYHRSYMSVARWCRGGYCFKESVDSICKSLKWSSPAQSVIKQAASLMKQIIYNKKPTQLLEYMKLPRTRPTAQIGKRFSVITKTSRKQFLNHGINIYNMLPDQLKNVNFKDYKKSIKNFHIDYKPD